MAIGTAAAIGLGISAAGTVYGAVKAGQAGSAAAEAQGKISEEQLAGAQKAASFAAPTTEELTTLNNQIQLYSNAYSNSTAQLDTLKKQVTDTYGSNIIEMGQQLHNELLGANSAITQQTNDQIQRQKIQYQQQLVSKLGPGALTSSAGIQAMATFDRNAQLTLAQVQDQSLNSLVTRLGGLQGSQSSAVQDINAINGSLTGMLGQIQSTQNNFQVRQSNAWNGVASYAGADQVQNLQNARNTAAVGNNISNISGQLLGVGIASTIKNNKDNPNSPITPAANANGLTTTPFQSGSGSAFYNPTPISGGNLNFYSPTEEVPMASTLSNPWDHA